MTPEGKIAHADAQAQRIEALARIVAAQKMALIKDPTGANLARSFWGSYVEKAALVLRIINWSAP